MNSLWHRGISSGAIIFFASVFLVLLSLVTLYSFEAVGDDGGVSFFVRQSIFAVLAFIVGVFFSRFPYQAFRNIGTPVYFASIVILVGTLLLGETVRGTAGWIDLGFARFQPVEGVKIALILFLAGFFVSKRSRFGDAGRILVSFVLVSVIVGLILLQPDFGSAVILLGIWAGMLFVSDLKAKSVFVLVLLALLSVAGSWLFLEDYQKDRVLATIHPEADARGSGYNVIQSMVAVGSGGMFGKGVGGGSQSQFLFLPERHTDFIFASVAESLGFVGAGFVLVLYGTLLFRIARAASDSQESFGFLIASGIYIMLLAHIAINIGMNLGIVPVTGIPLPLLSYGGSSLLATAAGLGMVVNIANKKRFSVSAGKDVFEG